MTDPGENRPETVLHRVAGQPDAEIDLAGAAPRAQDCAEILASVLIQELRNRLN